MAIKFVICGIEHSGTTLLSDLFRQVPGIDSGFEGGVLLCDSPRDFKNLQPFAENIKSGWGVTEEDLHSICDTDSYETFYAKLQQASAVVDKSADIFDKTPRYVAQLSKCIERLDVPFIVTYKDPRAIVYSDFQRAKTTDFNSWYREYIGKKRSYMKSIDAQINANKANSKVLMVSLESICIRTEETLSKAFDHVGVRFQTKYLAMKNLRYSHNHHPFIDSSNPFHFYHALRSGQISTLEKDFSELSNWFHE